MRVRVFQAGKGDCLLLESPAGTRVLIDGGLAGAFRDHVAERLSDMQHLDLVVVSHIDQDHIAGILALMDDMVAWRVHDYHLSQGNTHHPRPESPEPPAVAGVWHNAFGEQIGKNAGDIGEHVVVNAQLTGSAGNYSAAANGNGLPPLAEVYRDLATSIREGLQLNRRLGSRQLGIPVNSPTNGTLMMVDNIANPITVGDLTFKVIGPFATDLKRLRREWNAWLRNNKKTLRELRKEARKNEDLLDFDEGAALRRALTILATTLGDRNRVTTPNLASLMLTAEVAGRTLLLTGDGHGDDILRGLRRRDFIRGSRGFHVDLLKVQHHGSEHNLDADFCRWVTADHYLFCSNGSHHNPDLAVLETIIDSRIGPTASDSRSPGVTRGFKFWFNSSEKVTTASNKEHMKKVEELVERRAGGSRGKMKYRFLRRGSTFFIDL